MANKRVKLRLNNRMKRREVPEQLKVSDFGVLGLQRTQVLGGAMEEGSEKWEEQTGAAYWFGLNYYKGKKKRGLTILLSESMSKKNY